MPAPAGEVERYDGEPLATHGASKTFGGLAAVADVSLEVEEGDIHCLIGPNGAGKSTLFRLIVGTYPPTAGRIVFRGTDVYGGNARTSASSAA